MKEGESEVAGVTKDKTESRTEKGAAAQCSRLPCSDNGVCMEQQNQNRTQLSCMLDQ